MVAFSHAASSPRPLPTQHLAALVERAVPVLRYLEKAIHPRWHAPIEATKRLVGTVVVVLNITLVSSDPPQHGRENRVRYLDGAGE